VTRVGATATLVAALGVLTWATPTAAAGNPMRAAVRAEVGGAAGWSDGTALAGEGRLHLRLGPLAASLTVDVAGQPLGRHPYPQTVVGLGAGVVKDVDGWEAEGAALLAVHDIRYPDQFGTGPTDLARPGVGLRAGLGRHLDAEARRGMLVPWLGLSASVTWSGPTRVRVLEERHHGFVALVSVTVGAAIPLR